MGRNIQRIPTHALEALTSYDWPGNIRELQNARLEMKRTTLQSRMRKYNIARLYQ